MRGASNDILHPPSHIFLWGNKSPNLPTAGVEMPLRAGGHCYNYPHNTTKKRIPKSPPKTITPGEKGFPHLPNLHDFGVPAVRIFGCVYPSCYQTEQNHRIPPTPTGREILIPRKGQAILPPTAFNSSPPSSVNFSKRKKDIRYKTIQAVPFHLGFRGCNHYSKLFHDILDHPGYNYKHPQKTSMKM